ncbi:MAG: LysE family translocator [Zunongwangia sp.]|uniref:LysE type amino acid translocator n=2 Tax=Zunongwangia profunda TaxID=398743 RepID=D5BH38_ZUNPS|nr:LysE type amino acid translocator [Zunongwangia profunda SM-A87]MAO34557.1 LysE family translocator [Zunongwangia sp.]HAJ81834.1 LysE family translocator [Zunongwangia profunda]MAO37764.1 LysE family translocator [Zunongwangia sp.]MAS73004.1 LysE family translocator [Zunongwangia sp.]
MLEQLIPFLTATMLLTLAPGPDIIYVLVQGMVNGKKHAIVTALGLVSGVVVHTTLVAFGVSAVIKQSETIYLIIKCLGAAYLFYLAYKVFQSNPDIAFSAEGIKQKSLFALYRQGFIMNVLNPKVTIFFLALFPGFLWDPEGSTVLQFYILGGVFMCQALLIFTLVAILAGNISKYLQKHRKSGVILKWTQIFAFIAIGVFILM